MITYGRQNISQADIDAVVEVLRSDFLTQGPTVLNFEQVVADYCGAQYGVAVNSATSALHIGCLALGLGPGDWLWTSPNTFVASANAALYCRAKVDFIDIDPHTYNLCVDKLERKLQHAEKKGILPKIVMPVHFAGQPCNMPALHTLSQKYGFKIIEDASHAIGASYDEIKVGSCAHSALTIFSFHPVKVITTGEGGMVMTNSEALAVRLRRLRTHGITNEQSLMRPRRDEEIRNYDQLELGFNYRMTDIQAALGISQMKRLDEFVSRRHEIAERYNSQLKSLPIKIPFQGHKVRSSYHLYPIRINHTETRKTQWQVYKALLDNGVGANLHYIPVYRHSYYKKIGGYRSSDFPITEEVYKSSITIPMHPLLEEEEIDYVTKILADQLR